MIPNYPYFGLPNYMRYVNPQAYANPNQSFSGPNYYTSNFTPQPQKNYANTNAASYQNSSSSPTSKNSHNMDSSTNRMTNSNNISSNSKVYTKLKSSKNNYYSSNDYTQARIAGNTKSSQDSSPLFNAFGINLYFDDILLICIIFFLYNENVNDPCLFFSLIFLLLS